MAWHKQLFVPRPSAVETACTVCGRAMWLPATKVAEYLRCSKECIRAHQTAAREARRRDCETCGKSFTPRQVQIDNGGGRFCSQKCNTVFREAGMTAEVQARRTATRRQMEAEGRVTHYRGEDHPSWTGGKEAQRERRKPKERLWLREYRKKNPDKVREFSRRRQGRKLGKLPYGTLPRIRKLQNNRCAICRGSIAKASHVDHIMPLARGGRHEASNIQLLCPPCNLAKSSRDPIKHMQSLGRLL